jgi:hypothetical protein
MTPEQYWKGKHRFDKTRLGNEGFHLNHHINGGDVVVLPLHTKQCKRNPCTCGALAAMPESIVNAAIKWPDSKSRK